MKPVFQRIVDAGRGDCQTAAVASILELPYEQVPTWVADAFDARLPHEAHDRMLQWFREHGFHYLTIAWDDLNDWRSLNGVLCIASMPSQRFTGSLHAVVATWVKCSEGGHQFTIVHDPNPGNQPYPASAEPLRVSFLVPINPAIGVPRRVWPKKTLAISTPTHRDA